MEVLAFDYGDKRIGYAVASKKMKMAFAKDFMASCGVPTAEYRVCSSLAEAHGAIDELGAPVVVKADGLAAGKGVIVCDSLREAHAAAETIMRDRLFGEAGDTVVRFYGRAV